MVSGLWCQVQDVSDLVKGPGFTATIGKGSNGANNRLATVTRGVPEHIRSDNGPEFTATAIREWLARIGVKTLFIEPGSPWENGYIESFNGKLRDELLNGEVFETLLEAQVLVERWRKHCNTVQPHSALGYRPPAPEAVLPLPPRSATLRELAAPGGLT